MLKNPIPQVTNKLQYRAIGIINGKYTPHDIEQLNRGFLIDDKGEKIETVVPVSYTHLTLPTIYSV